MAVLRAKTDRQLVNIINATIDRAYRLLRSGVDEESYTLAEDAYCEAFRLASALHNAPEIQKCPIFAKVRHLREALDRYSERSGMRIAAAC